MNHTQASATSRPAPATRERAAEFGRLVSPRSTEIEKLRKLPDDVVEGLIDTGVFRMFVPRSYGGDQLDVSAGLDVIEELSYHDGAVGWCGMIGGTTALLAAYLPEEYSQQIYADDPRVVTGGATAPTGKADRRPEGLAVSGRWAWGSGTQHCGWIVGGTVLEDEAGGAPRVLLPFFEYSDVSFLDTWYSSGLCGTGSTDYEVNNAFVPEGRWIELGVDNPRVEGTLYAFPLFSLLSLGVGSVARGIGRRAIDEFKALSASKSYAGSSRALSERPAVHDQVARAEAELAAGGAFVSEAVEAAWEAAEEGSLTLEHRARLRLAVTFATQHAAAAVDRVYEAGGGTSVYHSNPLQRLFRDVHVATQHQMVAVRNYELLGRLALGQSADTRML